MKYNLPERVIRDISTFAKKHSVEKVILFGSRARGTNTERSDIDIAVYGGDFDSFYWDIKEKVHSLLMFDVVEIDAGILNNLVLIDPSVRCKVSHFIYNCFFYS